MNLDKLKEIKYQIAFYEIKEQAKYADSVCVTFVKNKEFVRSQFVEANDVVFRSFQNWNATSVGNLAYTSLFCEIPEISQKCLDFIEKYRNWIKENNLL